MSSEQKYASIPVGVEAISTRTAARILGCRQSHVRTLALQGRLGKRFKVSSRSVMLDKSAVQEYAKKTKGQQTGRPRKGFAHDT